MKVPNEIINLSVIKRHINNMFLFTIKSVDDKFLTRVVNKCLSYIHISQGVATYIKLIYFSQSFSVTLQQNNFIYLNLEFDFQHKKVASIIYVCYLEKCHPVQCMLDEVLPLDRFIGLLICSSRLSCQHLHLQILLFKLR